MSQYKWLWLRDTEQDCNIRDIQLVDAASRGPWGSLTQLPYLRKRWVVALGAITIITSIAIEPLVQQVPSFTIKTLHTPSMLANVPRVLTWMSQGKFSRDSEYEQDLTKCSEPTFLRGMAISRALTTCGSLVWGRRCTGSAIATSLSGWQLYLEFLPVHGDLLAMYRYHGTVRVEWKLSFQQPAVRACRQPERRRDRAQPRKTQM